MTEQEFKNWLDKNGFEGINSMNHLDQLPAHRAAEKGDVEALEFIAKHAPDTLFIQDRRTSRTPAHWAAYAGKIDTLRILAEKAPETLSRKTSDGITPIHETAISNVDGTEEVCTFLAEKVPETLYVQDRCGRTATHYTISFHNTEALKIIAKYAPDTLLVKDNEGRTPAQRKKPWEPFSTDQIEAYKFIFEKAPESLPTWLFDKSKEHKKVLKKIFASITNDMKKNFDGTKESVQKCVEKINHINKVFDEKTKEYKQEIKQDKQEIKQEKENAKLMKKNLKKLGKGKGE